MSLGDPVIPDEEVISRSFDATLMRRLLRYLRPYRYRVLLSVGLLLILSGLSLVGPYIIKTAIDGAIAADDLPLDERLNTLTTLSALFLAALALEFSVRYVQMLITQYVGQRVMYDLRLEIFTHLQKLSLTYFNRNPVGRLMTRVTSDVEVLNEMFTSGVVQIFGDIFLLAGIIAAMVLINAKLALITFSVLPMIFFTSYVFRRRVRDSYRDVRTRLARMNSALQESLTGMKVIQLFTAEKRSFERFRALNADHREAHLRSIFYYAVFFPVIQVIGALSAALIIWFGGRSLLEGALTFGALTAFLQYTSHFFQPIRDLSEKYNVLQSAMASSERIFLLLDTKPAITAPAIGAPGGKKRTASQATSLPRKGTIEFDHVWFAYNDDDWVLRDITLTVEEGERLALVGATGSGKSTLVTLLGRFYDVRRGAIRVGGVDVRELDPAELRRRIGTVLQDVFLFSGTIDRNIRLGDETISREEMIAASRIANAHSFVSRLEGKYDHVLQERGVGLSTGERQLLAFSRAIAFDPEIFVLDEATSNIDSETEALIQEALEKIMSRRTSIVIAHRLSTIRKVDRIAVLHHGEIREMGSHAELLRRNGLYRKLHDLEFGGGTPGPTGSISR